jgi:hypothetical protein
MIPRETGAASSNRGVGEARWPMTGAVIAAIALTFLLPARVRPGPNWLLPLIEILLLVGVVIGDPVEITRRSRWLRGLSTPYVFPERSEKPRASASFTAAAGRLPRPTRD